MAIITSCSVTIKDFNDGVRLTVKLDGNKPRTHVWDPTNQVISPAWTADSPLTITPNVVVAGTTVNLVPSGLKSYKWQRRIGSDAWADVSAANGETVPNTATKALVVARNIMVGSIDTVEYKFSGVYYDSTLQMDLTFEDILPFGRVTNGTALVLARAYPESGNSFVNHAPDTLRIIAELMRGTTRDSTLIEYLWHKESSSGYVPLTSSNTGYNTNTLTVTQAMVTSLATFKCKIKDIDPNSDTYQNEYWTEGISIVDLNDPYTSEADATADTFKNGVGESTITARVFQANGEIDPYVEGKAASAYLFDYKWYKVSHDGTIIPNYATGKRITVTGDDVNIIEKFKCDIDDRKG